MKASLQILPQNVISPIDPRIYSSFIEHMGRAVYTGIYEPDHPGADDLGFRRDVAEKIRKLNLSHIRYPGGNFLSGYCWEDGIGPREQRPVRRELAWFSLEPNYVGINEFVTYCREAGVEPMIGVNLGTRGPRMQQICWNTAMCPAAPIIQTCAGATAMSSPIISDSGAWAMKWTAPGKSAPRQRRNTAGTPVKPLK